METVEAIINKHGGIKALKDHAITIENAPYMKLCIEYIGQGPRSLPMVSVCHYGEQTGDLMRDPDMCFEVGTYAGPTQKLNGAWYPISYRNDYMNINQAACFTDEFGKVQIRPRLVKQLTTFSNKWDRNIKQQGFLNVAVKVTAT